jgi:VanZ family protein
MKSPSGLAACSLEIWLSPGHTWYTNTLLAFYAPQVSGGFSLHQSERDLVVENEPWSHPIYDRFARLCVHHVFRKGRSVFIAVTSDGRKTAVYVNGVLARESRGFTLSAHDLTGRLVIANSPVENGSWSGELRGLAIYDRMLTPAQVLRHYSTWTTTSRPEDLATEGAIGLYVFNEPSGNVIQNQVDSRLNLFIPKRYQELHHTFLERPWNEYQPTWSYAKDVLINIGGFIPFGFFVCAYLLTAVRTRRALLATLVLGAAVSLTIEVLQWYLPTRDSGMTDLFTNTLGTAMGVGLFWCLMIAGKRLSESRFPVVRYLAGFLAGIRPSGREDVVRSERALCSL